MSLKAVEEKEIHWASHWSLRSALPLLYLPIVHESRSIMMMFASDNTESA